MTGLLHCGSCLSLHKCGFVFEKAPVSPLHEKCHCTTVAIPATQVKNKAFESWGYTVSDSEWLQKEIEKQGKLQYLLGNYELGALNMRGQRISIRVTILRKKEQEKYPLLQVGW